MIYQVGLRGRAGAVREFVVALLGWLLVAPLTFLVPRDRGSLVFYGRDGGKFIDNCKHLYAEAATRPGLAAIYLARDAALRDRLRSLGGKAEVAGGWRAAWLWLRAGTIAVDSIDWMRGLRLAGSRGARVVQMWHGIPLKHVQLARVDTRRSRGALLDAAFALHVAVTGRHARTAWFLSTSEWITEHAFARSFRYDRISHAGYPRNDALFGPPGALGALGVDARAMAAAVAHAGPVALYAPTFREALEDPFATGLVDLAELGRHAQRLGVLLLVKLHPWMHGRLGAAEPPGVMLVSPESDAYPLMRHADLLVTDYSSIFFDYLLLDRPVLFFPYDLERYLARERAMYFDYEAMTPGPKARTLDALVAAMQAVVDGEDPWAGERERIRALVFRHRDGHASRRLLGELFP
jgi:CDP-glycerol glycerophosphotransferase (TagB/SpsB family)